MADLRIVDAPLLSTVKGTEKLPTGGEGNFSVSVNQVADFAKLKWFLATEGYVDNAVGNVQADLNLHKNNSSNPHGVTKVQVGLGNVDNTADLDKPVSNATQSAIITANSGKADKSYVDSQDQLKADKTTVESSLSLKADKVDLTASKISSDGGQTQQDINDFGGAKWHSKSGGYDLGATVKLTNGDILKSTIANNTVNPNVDITGWVKTNDVTQFIDDTSLLLRSVFLHKNAITTPNKNGSSDWRQWDWEEAILSCITYCAANNLTLTMPNGNVRYKGNLTFTCDVEAPQTRMIKVGSGAVECNANFKVRAIRTLSGNILSGDASRGLNIRSVVERCNVHVSEITGHGGDGAVFLKGNLSNIWVKSTRNGGRGFAIAADGAGDVRANTIYTEVTRNCLNLTDVPQFEIEDYLASGVPDNTKTAAYNILTVITQNCETGPGYALRGRSQFVEVYSENNKSAGILDTSLDGSEITLLNHAITTVTNNSNPSNAISSLFSGGVRTSSLVHTKRIVLSDVVMNSQLALEQTADRAFSLAASGSSNPSTLNIDATLLKLKYGALGLSCENLQTGTLNFGTILAGAVVERTKDISALTLPTYVTVSATPNFTIPAGVVWSAYIQGGAIRVRAHNPTGAAIEVTGAWVFHIHGFNTNQ